MRLWLLRLVIPLIAAGLVCFAFVHDGGKEGAPSAAATPIAVTRPQLLPTFASFRRQVLADCRQADRQLFRRRVPRTTPERAAYLRQSLTVWLGVSQRFVRMPKPNERHAAIAKLEAMNRRDVALLSAFLRRLAGVKTGRDFRAVASDFLRAQDSVAREEMPLARALGLGAPCVG